jgi:hypothetical protein
MAGCCLSRKSSKNCQGLELQEYMPKIAYYTVAFLMFEIAFFGIVNSFSSRNIAETLFFKFSTNP